MSKLMWIAGILLIAAGVAFGAVNLASLQPSAARISLDTSVLLLIGGILALGLGSVIDALHAQRQTLADRFAATAAVAGVAVVETAMRSTPAATPVAEVTEAATEASTMSATSRETLSAVEQARQRMEKAFQPKPEAIEAAATATAAAEEVVEAVEAVEDALAEDAVIEDEVVEEEAVIEDGQLYVVEERIIRLRPARILSDGTVEAETDEGWMRFENLEHLDEYLDAMEPAKA